jgi:hypothetical protein
MATVNKDFRIKSGLVVEGANATVNGSDIITEDILTGGTQENITVTYDAQNKVLNFVAENGVADSTTADLDEDPSATVDSGTMYFTNARARAAVSAEENGPLAYNSTTGVFDLTLSANSGLEIDPADDGLQLPDAAANTGTFGSSTSIPSITVDDKGRVTAVTTNDVATDLSIAGDSGTDTIDLLNDTLTFTGGDGITLAVSENTVTATADVSVGLEISGSGAIQIDDTVATLTGTQSLTNKTLGSGTTLSADLDAAENKIVNLADPVNAQDAATKMYVDSVAQGLDVKQSVRVASGEDLDLGSTSVVDGVTLASGDRVLVRSQTNTALNGIYVHSNGVLTRSEDADEPEELNAGAFVFVEEGTVYGDTGWVVSSNNPIIIGTDPMVWTQFSGAGTFTAGYGLTLTGTEFAVDNGEIVSQDNLTGAVEDLTEYIDGFLDSSTGTTVEYINDQDAATLASANTYTDIAIQTGDATATPTYLALDINSVAKQVAAASSGAANSTTVAYQFDSGIYRSAKFLVKIDSGTHTQVSEVLLTLDSSNNVAITEYAIVGTNGNLGNISADLVVSGLFPDILVGIRLLVNSQYEHSIIVMGTLLGEAPPAQST